MGFMISMQSCSDDFSTIEEIETSWQEATHLNIIPVEGKEAFVWEKNILTQEQYWKNTVVELDLVINSDLANTEVSKIDFYITAEEFEGYNYTAPFDSNGRLVSTVSGVSEDGKFTLTLNAEEVYELFSSDFKNNRTESQVLKDDLFELHWVVTAKDGSEMDSRNYVAGEYRYSFAGKYQELAPPIWQDTYDFEWLSGIDIFGMLGLVVAPTGEMTVTERSGTPGTYTIPNMLFNADFGIPMTGDLVFDFESGLTTVSNAYGLSWTVSNINGSSLDIEITGMDNLLPIPGAVYKVRLTRQDGANWPTNIHSN